MTVTRTSPCIAPSFPAPKMISASSPTASWMMSLIWVVSPSVRSSPPMMLMRTPVAPAIETLSSSGLESACWKGIPLPTTARSRSLGTTIMVSTFFRSSAMPSSACFIRRRPSNRNGLVTMPTVSAPVSRAIWATTGEAPVPVPPPMPQVTKTMSAPWTAWATSSRFSSMACRPISGLAPAPSPRVSLRPIWILMSDLEIASACASVLTEMNSTPPSWSSIMRLTALPPPPPTPTTFILAFCGTPVSSSSKIMAGYLGFDSEEVLEPALDRTEHFFHSWRPPDPGTKTASKGDLTSAVECQSRRHCHSWRFDAIRETAEPLTGHADPGRHCEHVSRELDDARGQRATSGQDNSGGQSLVIPRAADLVQRELQDLLKSHSHHVGEHEPLSGARPLSRGGRKFDQIGLGHQRLERTAVALAQSLRLLLSNLEAVHDIRRDVAASAEQRAGMANLAAVEHRDVGRSGPQLDQRASQLGFVRCEHGKGCRERSSTNSPTW